jgi:hypothetical protein
MPIRIYVPGRSSLGRTRARLPTRNHKPVVHGDRTSSHPARSVTSSILILARCRAGTIAARGDHGARRSCKEMDRSCPRPAHGPSIDRRGGRIGTVRASSARTPATASGVLGPAPASCADRPHAVGRGARIGCLGPVPMGFHECFIHIKYSATSTKFHFLHETLRPVSMESFTVPVFKM